MEHWRPDNKNNGTQPHHLTKKKNQARYLRKNTILQGKKTEKHIQNAHMKHCDGTDNNRPLLLNNDKTSMQDSIDIE